MKGLGREFNVIAVASGVAVALRNASGVSFVGKEDTNATIYTFTQTIGGGAPAALLLDPDYFASDGDGAVWTHVGATGTPLATLTKGAGAAEDCIVFYVGADQLDDGYDGVIVTADGGTLVAIIHDLVVQRDPVNLEAAAD